MNPNCTLNEELSISEASELLADLRIELESSSQSNLFDFVGLLIDLISILQTDPDDVDSTKLTEFVAGGLAEVRGVMAAESPCFEQVDLLFDQAIDSWGEQLAAFRESDDAQSDYAWSVGTQAGHEPIQEPEDADAPSAAEIQNLLKQLGANPPEPSQASATQTHVASEPVAMAAPSASESNSLTEIEELDPELQEAFLDDATSCIGSMEKSLLLLESNPRDGESLNQILRELHTLKGASSSVGLLLLAKQIHDLEDTLRDAQIANRDPSIDALFQSIDQIRSQILVTNSKPAVGNASCPAVQSAMGTAAMPVADSNFSDDDADDELVRVKSSQLNRLMDMLVELVMLRNQRETELSELQEVYHELINSVSKMRLLSNDSDLRADSSNSLQMSEVASDVLETAQHLRDCARPFADGNAAVSRFIRQFRLELVQLRRTPISGLFRRLQRVVRDAAKTESKQVRLTLLGEDAGIERSLQQRLYEPLMHIVRNSVCHGIETTAEREQSGKAPEGVVSLEAKSGPDLFVIEIRDDGRGLDYDAIRRRGVERGLLASDQAVSKEDLSQLIFHPGFSTREVANQASGRGVGMDVVAATMQRMRGWLEVKSDPGSGTCIRLSFPLPSAIQHAMVFRCAEQLFALPMESVQAAGEVSSDIPHANFSELLGLTGLNNKNSHAIVVANDQNTGKSSPLALFVDEIVGPEELVVRPLPSLLRHHPFCVGATLSGMGQTVILLDARRVLRSQTLRPTKSAALSTQGSTAGRDRPLSKLARILVVDDSLSARKRVVRSLQRYPLDIVEASDGKAALELVKKERFTAIFSDMEMPNIDGMEFLAEVCSPDRSDPPPVVIISSRSELEFTERARQLGAANYLIKPLEDQALDTALLNIAALKHLVCDTTTSQMEKTS